MGRRRPDNVDYHDCAFVITLITRDRLTYGPGSHLHVHGGDVTAVDAAGEERRVPVTDWEDVIVNAGDVLSNRWRRSRPAAESTGPPQPLTEDEPHRTD